MVLLISYPDWTTVFYFKNLLNRSIEFIELTSISEKVCKSDSEVCAQEFSLQIRNSSLTGVSLGSVSNAVEVRCGNNILTVSGNPSNPLSTKDLFNKDVIFRISEKELYCRESVTAKIYAPISQRKFGLSSLPILSDFETIEQIAQMRNLIKRDLKIYVLFLMVIVFLYSLFIRIVSVDENSNLRLKFSGMLLLASIGASGMLEVLIPIPSITQLNLWLMASSSCAVVAFGIIYLKKYAKHSQVYTLISLLVFGLLCAFHQSRVFGWIDFYFLAAVTYLFTAFVSKSTKIGISGILILLVAFNFNGLKWAPSSFIHYIYFSFLILRENHQSLLSYLKINRLLKLSRSKGVEVSQRKEHQFRTHALIKLFQKQFKIGRITILNLTDSKSILLQQYSQRSSQPESRSIEELTPIFAHVITTGNSLINVHVDSSLVTSLRRKEDKQVAASDYFTALPIFAGKEIIGAISLSDYSSEQFASSLNHSTFMFCLDILKGLLVEHLLTTPKTETLNKISKLGHQIDNYDFSSWITVEELIDAYADVLNKTFGWRIISATLPTPDYLLKVGRVYSFDPEVEKQVLTGKIYAQKDNRQGPLAVAVHEKKAVIVPNTKWLEGVVHPNTIKFFTIHTTRTAAFVPVLGPDGVAIGVYWIEGVRGNEISYSDRELFNSFVNVIHERLKLMKSISNLKISHQSLAQFLPKHLVDDYLSGKEVKENDCGFLMMFDLKGSTRLSHAIGNSVYHAEVENFKNIVEAALKSGHWILQQFIWDGFEFTYTSSEDKKEKLSIIEWKDLIESLFITWKAGLIERLGDKVEIASLSYRMCFTYGDTSRGIVVEGATQKWTFIGNAMAVVSKVEQAAKHLPGKVFCDPTILTRSHDEWIELHTTNQGLVVFGIKETNASEIKRAA